MAIKESTDSLFDEIDALKRKLSQLENAAHRVKAYGGQSNYFPADANHAARAEPARASQPRSTLAESPGEHRRLEEYLLYKHRRQWEMERPFPGHFQPGSFNSVSALGAATGTRSFTRFAEDFGAVNDWYGSRRERLRQNFELDLDRLYLEEEQQQRRCRENFEKTREVEGGGETLQQPSVKPESEPQAQSLLELAPRHMDWFTFMKPYWGMEGRDPDRSVVDVLVGEPVVSDTGFSTSKTRFPRRPPGYKARGAGASRSMSTDDPMPERIRISSSPLLNILSEILGKEGLGLRSPASEFVLLRPFKSLLYSQQGLRDRCQALERKFSPTTEWVAPAPTDKAGSAPASGSSGFVPSEDKSDEEDDEDRYPDNMTRSVSALRHLRCLLQVIDSDIGRRSTFLSDTKCRRVCYSDLWLLFQPGIEVIAKDGKQAYRVIKVTNPQHGVTPTGQRDTPFSITCVYIDFDGNHLGPVRKTFELSRFDGERDIISLAVYPLRCHPLKRTDFSDSEWNNSQSLPDEDRFRQKLILRGRKFLAVASTKQMYHTGPTLDAPGEVESQVVVDFEMALAAEEALIKKWKPTLEDLMKNRPQRQENETRRCFGDCCFGQVVADDTGIDEKEEAEYLDSLFARAQADDTQPSIAIIPRALEDIRNKGNGGVTFEVSDEELVIVSHRVFGFILRNRKWGEWSAYNLHPMLDYLGRYTALTTRIRSET